MTRKGNITEGIRAETGLEYQLILAVQRLEDEYAEREAATERLRATGASFAAGIQDWLERRFWERFYGEEELER